MNIQNLLNNLNNILASNNAAQATNDRTNEMLAKEQQPLQTPESSQTGDIKLSGQDAVNQLVKELTERFALAQKSVDSMPEQLKNEVRQLLSQRISIYDLGSGLSSLVQGQKDAGGSLSTLAQALENLAKFLKSSEQATEGEKNLADQLPKEQLEAKNNLLEKLDAQMIKQLLELLAKDVKLPEGKNQSTQQQAKPAGENQQSSQQASANNQAENTQTTKSLENLLRTLLQEFSHAAKEVQQAGKQENPVQHLKDLFASLSKENLEELTALLKNAETKNPEKNQSQEQQIPAKAENTNTLLAQAKENFSAQTQPNSQVTTQQVAELTKNLDNLKELLMQQSAQNPQLAKALQTLNSNPALLSSEEKELLQATLAQLIKQVFKEQDSLGTLEKALQQTLVKEKLFLDKQTSELQNFNRLLKNSETLKNSSNQVEKWANTIRELASSMIRTANLPAEKSAQHMQSSFVFNLATDGQEKSQPVYINVYHEKENENGEGSAPETWLRVKVEPENLGDVTAIFHLYQENVLDIKVIFANDEALGEFSKFVPQIGEALENTKMQINTITLI